jgi:hypothetical protein
MVTMNDRRIYRIRDADDRAALMLIDGGAIQITSLATCGAGRKCGEQAPSVEWYTFRNVWHLCRRARSGTGRSSVDPWHVRSDHSSRS